MDEHLEEHDEQSQHQGERGREERPAWAGTMTDRSVCTRRGQLHQCKDGRRDERRPLGYYADRAQPEDEHQRDGDLNEGPVLPRGPSDRRSSQPPGVRHGCAEQTRVHVRQPKDERCHQHVDGGRSGVGSTR